MANEVNDVDDCTNAGCFERAEASVVWPGRGRLVYCRKHFTKALNIAKAMGLERESLDVQDPHGSR